MKFKEFWEKHKELHPAIKLDQGSPGFIDIMRSWNSEAILRPENCDDVVTWLHSNGDPMLQPNPFKKYAVKREAANKTVDVTDKELDNGISIGGHESKKEKTTKEDSKQRNENYFT